MASDSRIPLMAKTIPMSSGSDTLKSIMDMRKAADAIDKQAAADQKKREAEEDERDLAIAVRAATAPDGTVDFKKVTGVVAQKDPRRALGMTATIQKLQHDQATTQSAAMDVEAKAIARAAHLLESVKTAEDYALVYPQIQRIHAPTAEFLGPAYSLNKINIVRTTGHTFAELAAARRDATALLNGGTIERAMERYSTAVVDQASWDAMLDFGRQQGLSEVQLAALGPKWEGEASKKRLMAISQTPAQRQQMDLRTTAEARAVEDQKTQQTNAQSILDARNERLGFSRAAAGRAATAGKKGKGGDDPTLPNGVQEFLAKLRKMYPGDYGKALGVLDGTTDTIYADHPDTSPTKMYGRLRALYGKTTEGDPEAVLTPEQLTAQRAIAAPIIEAEEKKKAALKAAAAGGTVPAPTPAAAAAATTTAAPPAGRVAPPTTAPPAAGKNAPLPLPAGNGETGPTTAPPHLVAQMKTAKPGEIYSLADGTFFVKDQTGAIKPTKAPPLPPDVAALFAASKDTRAGDITLEDGRVFHRYPNGAVMRIK